MPENPAPSGLHRRQRGGPGASISARHLPRAGAVCAIYANRHANKFIDSDTKDEAERRCIETGLAAFEVLEKIDAVTPERVEAIARQVLAAVPCAAVVGKDAKRYLKMIGDEPLGQA